MGITVEGGGALGRVSGRAWAGWRPPRLTWDTLVSLEPGLAGVEVTVALLGRRPRPAEWRGIRATAGQYVGWDGVNRRHPVLGSTAAYDAALAHLEALADRPGLRGRTRSSRG